MVIFCLTVIYIGNKSHKSHPHSIQLSDYLEPTISPDYAILYWSIDKTIHISFTLFCRPVTISSFLNLKSKCNLIIVLNISVLSQIESCT